MMPDDLIRFFEMGGYASAIWPSYLLTGSFVLAIALHSLRQSRKTRSDDKS